MARGAQKAAVNAGPVEGPWGLPEGWRWERLGNLGDWCGGGTPSKADQGFWTDGTVPWVSAKDMKSDYIDDTEDHITDAAVEGSSAKRIPAGSVLCVMRSGILRHSFPVAVTVREVTINQDLRALTPRADVNPVFLAHFLKRTELDILHECSKDGTTVNSIDASRLMTRPVPKPSREVQDRVVAQVGELFAEIDDGEIALSRARMAVERFRKSVLSAAIDGDLTADWRSRNPSAETSGAALEGVLEDHRRRNAGERGRYAPPMLPNADLSALPDGWCWASVEAVGDVQLGRQRAPQHHDGDHMRPYLRVANVMEDRLDLTDVKWMNFTPHEYETFALRDGDVLLNEGQTPELLGRPAIYRGEVEGCCFQKTLLRFRAGRLVNPEFALIVFRHFMHSGRFKREARITTNIGHLTQVRFLPMEFPVPPLAEQAEIVRLAKEAERAALDLPLGATDTAALRQSILAAAFRGDLVA